MIGVVVLGARGRMGRTVVAAVEGDPELRLLGEADAGDDVAGVLRDAGDEARRSGGAAATAGSASTGAPSQVIAVDFTTAESASANAAQSIAAGVAPVIGTTGIAAERVAEIERAAIDAGLGGAVIPNFAIGAVLMIRLAELAAPHFDAVEVIEAHAETKLDAPSGTALHTAERLAAARREAAFSRNTPSRVLLPGTRGGERAGVGVHSLRLPGVVADQEVVFGALGQTLTVSHRTTSRESFMPGVLATVKAVATTRRFYRSLDDVLGLT